VTLYDVLRSLVRGDRELTDAGWITAAMGAIGAHEAAAGPVSAAPIARPPQTPAKEEGQ
jgi:hypothetical protein